MPPEKVDKETKEGQKSDAQRLYVVTVPMGAANTEHHIVLTDVKGFRLQCRSGKTFRFAFEMGKVGSSTPAEPYYTVPTDGHIEIKNLDVEELYLYLACGNAGEIAEIIVWK